VARNPLAPVKEIKDPWERQIVMQRDIEALKPDHALQIGACYEGYQLDISGKESINC
jgi:hypothetical protein